MAVPTTDRARPVTTQLTRGLHASWRLLGSFACALLVLAVSIAEDATAAEKKRKEKRSAPAVQTPAATLSEAGTPVPAAGTAQRDSATAGHPLLPAIEIAKSSLATVEQVQDYTARFNKRELVGKRYVTQTMDLKLRHEPFSVYLNFLGAEAGREVIYVAGANRGQMLVHEAGLKSIAGTVNVLPNGPEVMKENRHPLTQLGIANMLKTIIGQWERETQFGEIDVKYFPNAKLGEVACKVIQTSHPQPRREFPFHMTRLYFDKETNLPIRVEQHGFPANPGDSPPLIEEYTYTDLRTNVQLTDADFNPRNPRYRF